MWPDTAISQPCVLTAIDTRPLGCLDLLFDYMQETDMTLSVLILISNRNITKQIAG